MFCVRILIVIEVKYWLLDKLSVSREYLVIVRFSVI